VAGRRRSPAVGADTLLVLPVVAGEHTGVEMGLQAAERRRQPAYLEMEVEEERSLPVAGPAYLVPDHRAVGPVTANLCRETPGPNPPPPLE
jgi:hypothetical protein